jgi:uncharacterized protein
VESALAAKRAALDADLKSLARVVVAYSGGVDSSFLAAAAHDVLGDDCLVVTASSPALPESALMDARSLARARGWNHLVVRTHEVEHERYARNAPDRCYWCKSELFDVLDPLARRRDARIAVGTNADDLGDFRPGIKAAARRAVRAPLADARLTKADVRALSAAAGLPTADKPASPCLASRFAYGVRVTEEGLHRIDRAEKALRALGFRDLRVRDHGDLARIEIPVDDVQRAAELRSEIVDRLEDIGFAYVTLDLAGFRSGSLNEVLGPPRIRGITTKSRAPERKST